MVSGSYHGHHHSFRRRCVLGWLASIVMRTNGQQGIILNIVLGIIGSFLAGYLITR
jgi:uncharacterized membrane protein YeaQ/YmgE (transglycosylase-associated protein family)